MSKLHPKHRITRKKLYFFIVSLPLLCAGLLFSLAIVNQKENLDPRSEAATLKRKKDKIDIKYEKLDSFKPPVFDPSSSYSTPPSTPYTTDFHNEPTNRNAIKKYISSKFKSQRRGNYG